ncbi:MAG TPA: ribosome maturation factor RimP [Ignavibacteriaceae bacterium]|jgi:ribosome maturation factor RimP|nr:ribosome maturation factor RimP [Ignavibacteriaceae bacterium]
MNLFDENIRKIAAGKSEDNGFFLVDIIFRGNPNNRIIEIFIDGEKNVSADDCAKVSREIEEQIESLGLIDSSYRLEVSSPGVDRPLKFLKQYPKHINRKFEISYKPNDETKKLVGKLIRIEGENLIFQSDQKNETIINFNNITKAKVLVSFS